MAALLNFAQGKNVNCSIQGCTVDAAGLITPDVAVGGTQVLTLIFETIDIRLAVDSFRVDSADDGAMNQVPTKTGTHLVCTVQGRKTIPSGSAAPAVRANPLAHLMAIYKYFKVILKYTADDGTGGFDTYTGYFSLEGWSATHSLPDVKQVLMLAPVSVVNTAQVVLVEG